MAVYVDPLRHRGWILRGHRVESCHMFTDTVDLADLHAIAFRIGMAGQWFQDATAAPHYDLTKWRRADASAAGAIEVDQRTAAQIWRRRRSLLPDSQKSIPQRSRTALQHDQRLTTLARDFKRYAETIATIGTPATSTDKRRLTMASKMLKRIDAELRSLQP